MLQCVAVLLSEYRSFARRSCLSCRCVCVLQCVAVYCIVLQCVAVCWSVVYGSVLQCVAVCCSAHVKVQGHSLDEVVCRADMCACCRVFQCIAESCSVLQCVAVCCSVLQGIGVRYSVLHVVHMCVCVCAAVVSVC